MVNRGLVGELIASLKGQIDTIVTHISNGWLGILMDTHIKANMNSDIPPDTILHFVNSLQSANV